MTISRIGKLLPRNRVYLDVLMSTTIPPGNTGSRLITEVKPGRAKLVLGWVTAWEYFV